jgi:hypothetical protein
VALDACVIRLKENDLRMFRFKICAFGFGLQQLVVGSLGNVEVAIDLAGAEFDFQHSRTGGVRNPGQGRGYKGYAMHGFAPLVSGKVLCGIR